MKLKVFEVIESVQEIRRSVCAINRQINRIGNSNNPLKVALRRQLNDNANYLCNLLNDIQNQEIEIEV